ncbi:hypothetical protein NEAUS05_2541 [Nematocida ausubeli]|nr:hypothetical protein NEAUS07_2518 [Nematocida ausubeli]KAI5151586.1 hypothetical protein NEAUS05_2541 [Nematocida ausubeli]
MENLSEVKVFSEQEIVNILRHRYNNNIIYTFTGRLLISINPYRLIDIYNVPEYAYNVKHPHIYTVAENAYQGVRHGMNQVIILSGESGSGKSVNANYILKYLGNKESAESTDRITYVSDILELFGNASTDNNNNSSRFGKYTEILYKNSKVSRITIKAFLLEKSRADNNSEGSNFHAIMMITGILNERCKESLNKLDSIMEAFCALRICKYAVIEIFKYLILVKYLIDIDVSSDIVVDTRISHILGVHNDLLHRLLSKKYMKMGNEVIIKEKTHKERVTVKNTLIRIVYERLFKLVVNILNEAINRSENSVSCNCTKDSCNIQDTDIFRKPSMNIDTFLQEVLKDPLDINMNIIDIDTNRGKDENTIGILDIYGFEIMNENGFDQLCINYANERIHSEYITRVINENISALQEEGVAMDINIIEGDRAFNGPHGIINLLQEETLLPCGSIKNWLTRVSHNKGIRVYDTNIEVEHYSGRVRYNANEFIEKNNNAYSDVYDVLNKTGIKLLQQDESMIGRMTSKGILSEFKESLNNLLHEINKDTVEYVRCIKPGQDIFNDEYVKRQLKMSGVFETVKIFMLGYHMKYTKDEYAQKYMEDAIEGDGIQVGKKYIFVTEAAHNRIEKERIRREEEERERIRREEEERERIRREEELELERIKKEKEEQEALEKIKKEQEEQEKIKKEQEEQEELEKIQKEKEEQESYEEANPDDHDNLQQSHVNPLKNSQRIKREELEMIKSELERIKLIKKKEKSVNYEYDDNSSDILPNYPVSNEALAETCNNCSKIEDKYTLQGIYLMEKEDEIIRLKNELDRNVRIISDKDMLIRDLSQKIEVMLYNISTGEYYKTTTKPLKSEPQNNVIFKKIIKIFLRNIPEKYPSYYSSVGCAFSLFRISALCAGSIPGNIHVVIDAFSDEAMRVLQNDRNTLDRNTYNKSCTILCAFFLGNSIFIARTSPGKETEAMVQKVFSAGCTALVDEIISFGFDFLFSKSEEGGLFLSRILNKRPSLETVISHLKMIHQTLCHFHIPPAVISCIFTYIVQVVDQSGFECLAKKKEIGIKHIVYLNNSINTLTAFLLDIIPMGTGYFPQLQGFTEFVEMQRKGAITGSALIFKIGPFFSSAKLKSCVSALLPELRSKYTDKLQQALMDAEDDEESAKEVVLPVLPMPLGAASDDPHSLYTALLTSPEREKLASLLQEHGLETEWIIRPERPHVK